MPYRVGVMISGSATTFEAFCLNIAVNELPIEVPLLVADREAANLQVANRLSRLLGWKIRPLLLDRQSFPDGPTDRRWDMTDGQSSALLEIGEGEGVELYSQQGWLTRTRGVFLDELGLQPYHDSPLDSRILNNHPGIPKDTPGLWGPRVHEVALENGRTAFTVHAVSEQYDRGLVYRQIDVPILPGDTAKDVERSVQAVEKANTAQIMHQFLDSVSTID